MARPLLAAAAVVTAAAGALHLAAARAHTDVPLLAVAFVLVGLVQLVVVAVVPRRPALAAELVVAVDLSAVGAWAVSRTVGLPGLPPEAAGAGDLLTVALELVAVALILLPHRVLRWATAIPGVAAAGALVVVALAAPVVGHAHDAEHGHDDDQPAATPVADDVASAAGPAWFEQPGAADTMRARMTGSVGNVPIDTPETPDHGHDGDAAPHGH